MKKQKKIPKTFFSGLKRLIIHHNEKNQRIYFWCAAKDNWASQISEVAFKKIPISTIRAIIKNFQSTEIIVLMHGEEDSLSG